MPYLKFLFQAVKFIRTQKLDAVHCHDLPDLPIGIVIKAIKRVPLVYDAHEIYWIMDLGRYPEIISYFQKKLELFLLRWVDVLITVGKKRMKYYRSHYRKEIFLVGNYYDPKKRDSMKRKNFRESLSIPESAFVITYAGTLSKIRGIDIIVECAARMQDEKKNVHFVIAGVGANESIVKETAARNPLVHFLGWVSDLDAAYCGSDALLYLMRPSHPYAHYNSPNNLYLSIAWQLPLVGVCAGEIANALVSGESGMLLSEVDVDEFYNALTQLAGDKEMQQRIVQNVVSLQNEYSWQVARQSLYRAYDKF
jgi:glycosyltransferase involved in cell wall biosynthesis